MIRILFIQKLIFDYRISFYEAIGSIKDYDVTILHSGKRMRRPDSKFNEIIVPEYSLMNLLWQKDVFRIAKNADVVIGLFDVHYISTVALTILPHKFSIILWGIGFGHNSLANYIRLLMAKRVDALALYMPGNGRNFTAKGINKEKIFFAKNTVHVDKPVFSDNILKKDHFLFIGSLKRRKKVEELFYAFKKSMHTFKKKMYIDIIGDGEMLLNLQNLVKILNLEDYVAFHGEINDNEMLKPFFARALAIVSPGQAGLTILHGFAHGVPVVTQKNAISGGEIENITDGLNGVLYDGSITGLSNVLTRLVNDTKYAYYLGQNAYKYYTENMTLDHMVTSFRHIIDFTQKKMG